MSRRMLSLVAALLVLPSGVLAQTADTIYHAGTIVTVNDRQPTAGAVAVRGGKIIAVGEAKTVMTHRGPQTRVVNLKGRTMIPGFIDAHGHVSMVGVQAISANLLPPPDGQNDSIAAVQQTLRKWIASSTVSRDFGIVIGFGYDESQLKEQRPPNREDLDAVSKTLPVVALHQSGHLVACNSKALEIAGITSATKDPAGGVIRRKPGGNVPDGVLEETAMFSVLAKVVAPKVGSREMEALITEGQKLYAKYGHTTAQDGRSSPGVVKTEERMASQGKLILDIVAYPDIDSLGKTGLMSSPYYSRTVYRGNFRIGGVKMNLDGSPQGKTAWLTKPYFVPPQGQSASYKGYSTYTDAQAAERVKRAFKNNWQILVHQNGDAAIDQFIEALAEARRAYPNRSVRPVAIHAQTARRDQVAAYKRLGIFPSLFPMHTYYWGDWHRDSVLGRERAQNISPAGWVLSEGLMFTSHHDAPVAFPDTLRVLSATVNRTTRTDEVLGPQHRVSPIVALKAMTLWAAYQHFEEKTKGSIEVGKVADFAILSENPLTVEPSRIANIKVMQTIKRDKAIYTRPPSGEAVALSVLESPRASLMFNRMTASAPGLEAFRPCCLPEDHTSAQSCVTGSECSH